MALAGQAIIQHPSSAPHLRRSNALRIKSNNFEILPLALRESLQAIRARLAEGANIEEEGLSLLEQIKRGVKLKPVAERASTKDSGHRFQDQDESISELLVRVLRQRYLTMQQIDGESDSSSIESNDLYLVGHSGGEQGAPSCVLYGSGGTMAGAGNKRRTLLEKLGECSTIEIRSKTVDLTNDLVIRL